jgi:hypothetical protein
MEPAEYVVDFPTLGDLVDAWVEQHCRVPDGYSRRQPFKMADWQFWCTANHYRIRDDAKFDPATRRATRRSSTAGRRSSRRRRPARVRGRRRSPASRRSARRSSSGGPKPATSTVRDNGCPCGWSYAYLEGEPKGARHPSPLIQLTATSEDQVDNVYRPLTAMIRMGPLASS